MHARGLIWVVATTVGLIVAGFLFHFPGSFGGLYGWDPVAVVFGALIGFVSGAAVGLVQWAALLLPPARRASSPALDGPRHRDHPRHP